MNLKKHKNAVCGEWDHILFWFDTVIWKIECDIEHDMKNVGKIHTASKIVPLERPKAFTKKCALHIYQVMLVRGIG